MPPVIDGPVPSHWGGPAVGHPPQPPLHGPGAMAQTQYMASPHPGPERFSGQVPDSGQGAQEPVATRLSGPLFRDDAVTSGPAPVASVAPAEQTAVLPPIRTEAPPMTEEPPAPGPSRIPRASQAADPAAATKSPKGGRDLRAAIGVGVGLGAVVVLSLFIVKWLFVVVVAAVVVIGMWELTSRLSESKGIRVPRPPLAVGGVGMLVAAYLGGPESALVALALTSLAVLVWRMAEPPEDYLRDVTAGIFTAFYVPFLATFVMLMLAADDGPRRVAMFLVLTVCSDTGAYAAGSRFGRHKLAPRISPGKTREGLVGGVVLCMAAGALGMQLMIEHGSWWQGLVLGACVAVSATLGDLGESMIKRDLGIKDMGTILPGHGGLMDRLDSLLPTAPVVWLVLVGFVGAG
ncbi:phosphatidate cytidylyltransferase [Streptacidiphilus sp. MAP12-16]|uniref:phosphatidate cytidylyltransferase n=1 Tax=Streptacidiphilus sp. MAP12-16 TaxID=3156300 RepID=UPI003511A8B5